MRFRIGIYSTRYAVRWINNARHELFFLREVLLPEIEKRRLG